jgi:hypothetical protein
MEIKKFILTVNKLAPQFDNLYYQKRYINCLNIILNINYCYSFLDPMFAGRLTKADERNIFFRNPV